MLIKGWIAIVQTKIKHIVKTRVDKKWLWVHRAFAELKIYMQMRIKLHCSDSKVIKTSIDVIVICHNQVISSLWWPLLRLQKLFYCVLGIKLLFIQNVLVVEGWGWGFLLWRIALLVNTVMQTPKQFYL